MSGLAVVAGFITLAVALGFKRPVWQALLLASLTTGLAGLGVPGFLDLASRTATSTTAVDLVTAVFLVSVFVNLYNSTGFVKKMGEELVRFLKRPRLVATLVPAVMGLLPVPGGALMSAPVVESIGGRLGLSREKMVFVNVWFRHVVFVVYPLSATIITTASLAGVSVWSLVLRGLPVAVSMVAVGYLIGFRGARGNSRVEGSADGSELARALLPLVVAVALAASTSPLLDGRILPQLPLTRYSMLLALAVAITSLLALSHTGPRSLAKAVASRTTVELVIASFAAVLLRDVFVVSGGPELVSKTHLAGSGAGSTALMALLPFAVSFATGSPVIGVVIALSVLKPTVNLGLRETALVYSSNMLGYIASPAHLCYVYTVQYFKTNLTSTYRDMLLAIATAVAVSIVVFTAI